MVTVIFALVLLSVVLIFWISLYTGQVTARDLMSTNRPMFPATTLYRWRRVWFFNRTRIYLPGEGAVRIEDLVLVTETGYEVLNYYQRNYRL